MRQYNPPFTQTAIWHNIKMTTTSLAGLLVVGLIITGLLHAGHTVLTVAQATQSALPQPLPAGQCNVTTYSGTYGMYNDCK